MAVATEIWCTKLPNGALMPHDERSKEYADRFKAGSVFKLDATMKRNGKHHRLGMMLLQAVFDNQDRYDAFPAFLNEVKILTGHCEMHVSLSGQTYFIAKSIAFENMDELEFKAWKNDALNVVIRHFLPDMAEADASRIEQFIFAVS